MADYELFTDGACEPNPGTGGWAFILKNGSDEIVMSGCEPHTTNNRMEMMAVIQGLAYVPIGARVLIVTDSKYVESGCREWRHNWRKKGWSKGGGKLKNVDLWKHLDRLLSEREPTYQHVYGHNGHRENERCDQLAGDARRGNVVSPSVETTRFESNDVLKAIKRSGATIGNCCRCGELLILHDELPLTCVDCSV